MRASERARSAMCRDARLRRRVGKLRLGRTAELGRVDGCRKAAFANVKLKFCAMCLGRCLGRRTFAARRSVNRVF